MVEGSTYAELTRGVTEPFYSHILTFQTSLNSAQCVMEVPKWISL